MPPASKASPPLTLVRHFRNFILFSLLFTLLSFGIAACNRTPAPPPPTNDIPTLLAQAIALLEAKDADTFVAKILDPQHIAALAPGEAPHLKTELLTKRDYYLSILRAASSGKIAFDPTGDHATLRAVAPAGNALVQCVKLNNTWYIVEMIQQPPAATAP